MTRPRSLSLALYRGVTAALEPVAPLVLRRRLARGKEDPARWAEKLGRTEARRPEGALVWFHAVGLGEVMALRGLIGRMQATRPDLSVLVTSTALASGQVFARDLPPGTQHQFLPLDLPRAGRRFLDHWRPDLSVWVEQDLWPGLAGAALARGPVALINARMDRASFAARNRFRGLYAPLLRSMAWISAQDPWTAANLTALGARPPVAVTGPLKAAAPPLPHDPARLAALMGALGGRRAWLLASSHPEDEAVALAALGHLPGTLLIIAPRRPERAVDIARACPLPAQRLSDDPLPRPQTRVFIADSFGDMGLWLRAAPVTLMGGTFGPTEGHNPWEPAVLGSAILRGPRTANFRADFRLLDEAGAALRCDTVEDIVAAMSRDLSGQRAAALGVAAEAAKGADLVARELLALIGGGR